MTGKLMFVPDTHVVVPRKLDFDGDMQEAAHQVVVNNRPYTNGIIPKMWDALLANAPPLIAPPVLRWEQDSEREDIWELLLYGAVIAVAHNNGWDAMYAGSSQIKKNPEQARRAAEKALGLPIVEEV